MPTSIYGFEQFDDEDPIDDIFGTLNSGIQSIENHMPVRYAASLSALNAMSGSLHPDGQIAVLTADSSGLKEGAFFIRSGSKWLFAGGQVSNLATFDAALTSNIGTQPGASFYDISAAKPRIFTTTTGDVEQELVVTAPSVDPAIPNWVNISHISGSKNGSGVYPFGYLLSQDGKLATLRGTIQKTSGTWSPPVKIGSLPSAIRPDYVQFFAVPGSGNSMNQLRVEADGDIFFQFKAVGLAPTLLQLDGVVISVGA